MFDYEFLVGSFNNYPFDLPYLAAKSNVNVMMHTCVLSLS